MVDMRELFQKLVKVLDKKCFEEGMLGYSSTKNLLTAVIPKSCLGFYYDYILFVTSYYGIKSKVEVFDPKEK